jgi:hypothetical protein
MIDPWLSYFGHPKLPAGYDADDHNGDDINGAGTNWPVWPELFDTFVSFEVLFITEEMLEFFVTGCPDYVIPRVPNLTVLPRENRVYVIGEEGAGNIHISGVDDTIRWPREVRQQTMRRRA